MRLFDKDGDGRVSRHEVLQVVDSDGDGSVSSEEIQRFQRYTNVAAAVAAVVFDGQPVPPEAKAQFAKLDEGGDGVVTRAELAKVLEKLGPPAPREYIGCYASFD